MNVIITLTDEQFAQLAKAVAAIIQAGGHPPIAVETPAAAAPPPPPPPPPSPPPKPTVKSIASPLGARWDLPCGQGTLDTITLPTTNHTLSIPMDEQGEMIMGYIERVHRQCGDIVDAVIPGGTAVVNMGFQSTAQHLGLKVDGPPKLVWPVVVDCLLNQDAYFPPDAATVARNAAAWAEVHAGIAASVATASDPLSTDVKID